jgi:hypothetical protein
MIPRLKQKVERQFIREFIAANGLVKRLGYDEWYSRDNKTRIVHVGERYRMDINNGNNWSAFRSYYVVGPREREFRSVIGRRRW